MSPMSLRRYLLPLALTLIAANVIAVGLTHPGVGPVEHVTLAALAALLLVTAFRLVRRTAA